MLPLNLHHLQSLSELPLRYCWNLQASDFLLLGCLFANPMFYLFDSNIHLCIFCIFKNIYSQYIQKYSILDLCCIYCGHVIPFSCIQVLWINNKKIYKVKTNCDSCLVLPIKCCMSCCPTNHWAHLDAFWGLERLLAASLVTSGGIRFSKAEKKQKIGDNGECFLQLPLEVPWGT